MLLFIIDAEFRNTGLERSAGLAKDLEWFKEQGHAIPEPSEPGITYAEYLKELSEKDPQAFICHFYNIYFAHSAGGRMIGRKVIRTMRFLLSSFIGIITGMNMKYPMNCLSVSFFNIIIIV